MKPGRWKNKSHSTPEKLCMKIIKATEQFRDGIKTILKENNLPSEDLPRSLNNFYLALDDKKIIGVIGLERYDQYGLLRSMVVDADHRNKHIAEELVKIVEEEAGSSGVEVIYLLTETADKYFNKKGYHAITREQVPGQIKSSSEFNHVCPASAVVMKKEIFLHPTIKEITTHANQEI